MRGFRALVLHTLAILRQVLHWLLFYYYNNATLPIVSATEAYSSVPYNPAFCQQHLALIPPRGFKRQAIINLVCSILSSFFPTFFPVPMTLISPRSPQSMEQCDQWFICMRTVPCRSCVLNRAALLSFSSNGFLDVSHARIIQQLQDKRNQVWGMPNALIWSEMLFFLYISDISRR